MALINGSEAIAKDHFFDVRPNNVNQKNITSSKLNNRKDISTRISLGKFFYTDNFKSIKHET